MNKQSDVDDNQVLGSKSGTNVRQLENNLKNLAILISFFMERKVRAKKERETVGENPTIIL